MDKHIFKKNAALTQEESNNCIKYFEEDKDPKEDKIRGYSLVFASLRYDEFKFFGGDMEKLFFTTKISHSIRIFGNIPKVSKIINLESEVFFPDSR